MTTNKTFRGVSWQLWLAGCVLLGAEALMTGCSQHDDPIENGERTAVTFTAGIDGAAVPMASNGGPKTRTTATGDEWVSGDGVGIFMLTANGALTNDGDRLADNKKHTVTNASTGEVSPEGGTPICYLQSGTVDFVAYYPYGTASAGSTTPGTVNSTGYTYTISIAGQSDPAAIDVLYTKQTGVSKQRTAVNLEFEHKLSKVTLNVKAGEGIAPGDISGLAASALAFGGMPVEASVALQNGAVTADTDLSQTFNPLKVTTTSGYQATFSAILVPQAGTSGRTVVFTVGGQPYTWAIPDSDVFAGGTHYIYEITMKKTGITVGTQTITPWTPNDNGTGTAKPLPFETVRIKAGTFQMGSPDSDAQAWDDEKPRHWVRLTKDFYMGKYEVTNSQYAAFLNANSIGSDGMGDVTYDENGSNTTTNQTLILDSSIIGGGVLSWGVTHDGTSWKAEDGYENHPVIYVTWYGAKAYADWVGGSLPTEAQWEYACRAGTTTIYSYGDTADGDYMWCDENNIPDGTKGVGLKKANPWGLYDMHGNVNEWCLDQWDGSINYPTAATEGDAIPDPLVTSGLRRAARGGAFSSSAGNSRSAFRNYNNPYTPYANYGFRVVFVP